MTLDLAVARAVMAARQIERALHDSGPWSIQVGGVAYPAVRWIGEDRVIFRAHLPNACWLAEDPMFADLMCRDEVVGTRAIEPVDGDSFIEWVLALPAKVTTSA